PDERVEDTIDDGPVVLGTAGRVLRIGVGRSPFERRRAVAAREQVVGADEHRHRAQLRDLREELLPVLHVGVVRLVVAEKRPHRRQWALALTGVDANRDGLLSGGLDDRADRQRDQAGTDSFYHCAWGPTPTRFRSRVTGRRLSTGFSKAKWYCDHVSMPR